MRSRTPAAIAARLTYQGVTHRYGGTEAVSDFSLDIAPGEIVSLLGPSGCGKTTLLRLAAGVERPSAGRILINEREVAGANFEPPERRGVGLMFQDFALFPHLSNLANVMFGLKSMPKADAEREARLSLERVGLASIREPVSAHAVRRRAAARGAGARGRAAPERVADGRAVLRARPPPARSGARGRAACLRESRVTCVIVTHDAEEAMRVADRIALMRAGRLIQVGEPRAIYRRRPTSPRRASSAS